MTKLGRSRAAARLPAAAQMELDVIAERRRADPATTVRPTIRPLRPGDGAALAEMALRCSSASLHHRFHAPVDHLEPSRLLALLRGRRAAITLVADVDGAIVGVATLHPCARRTAEIAVLVEDRWQSGLVGTRLTAHLFRRAGEIGIRDVIADVQREQGFVIDRLVRAVDGSTVTFDGPIATVHLPVRRAPIDPRRGASRSAHAS